MVVRYTTTYAISAYHHWCCEFESRSGRGVQHYVIKFVSDMWQEERFSLCPPGSSAIKTDHHDITEILLNVALNTIKQTKQTNINHNSANILTLIYSPPWLSRGEFPNECILHWVAEKNREVKKLINYSKRERTH